MKPDRNNDIVTTNKVSKQLHGILKREKGTPSLAKEWAEHKRDEREIENRRGR